MKLYFAAVSILLVLAVSSSVYGAACSTSGGGTVLANAANGLSEGAWCEITMGGLTSDLVTPANGTDNCSSNSHLEYSSVGGYDTGNKRIGIAVGPHKGSSGIGPNPCGDEDYVFFLYDETSDTWSLEDQSVTPLNNGGHGFDLTSMDPATGDFYVNSFNREELWRRNADEGDWEEVGEDTPITCYAATCASGTVWDVGRGGHIRFGDSNEGGLRIWTKSSETFSEIQPAGAFDTSDVFDYVAEYYPPTGLLWVTDGNGYDNHWMVDTDDSVTVLDTPSTTLGCCGSVGRIILYDFRTQLFIVADPFSNTMSEYDLVADSWVSLGSSLVPFDAPDSSNVEGFGVPINAYGGVILYVMGRGTSGNETPAAYLYKHLATNPQCDDGIDNDGDHMIDLLDPSCSGDTDNSEASPGSDFETRCGGANVSYCNGFDYATTSEMRNGAAQWSGHPVLDASTVTSGDGSLRYDTTEADSVTPGSMQMLLDATGFDEGDTFYVQWRQRFDTETLDLTETSTGGGGGWKQVIFHNHTASSDKTEQTVQNINHRGMAQGYGRNDELGFVNWEVYVAPDYHLQYSPAVTECIWDSGYDNEDGYPWTGAHPYCATSNSPCVCYIHDDWMTFLIRVKISDPWDTANGEVELWVAYEDGAYTKVMERTVANGKPWTYYPNSGPDYVYDSATLTPFNTGATEFPVGTATTWYEELIVSTSSIPVPAGGEEEEAAAVRGVTVSGASLR